MDTNLRNETSWVIKGVIAFDFIVILLLLITSTFSKPMLLGLLFGSIIAILNFRLLAIAVNKMVTMPVSRAQIYYGSQYILRMTIIGIVLLVSVKAPHLNILGVAIGLLGPKFVILSKKLLIDKLKRKEA